MEGVAVSDEQQPTTDQTDVDPRRDKLAKWRAAGVNPYPWRYERTHLSRTILDDFDVLEGKQVAIAGRMVSVRKHGKSCFFHLRDGEGQIQCYARANDLGPNAFERIDWLDIGDIVGVTGEVFKTRTGEITVRVERFDLLSKSMLTLPEKYHGLTDTEMRYRRRYLDLIANPEVATVFRARARILTAIRSFLDDNGFLETETPVLQPIYGGAAARPFKTHHNALDAPFYLRIADELYLKRLIVGGIEKVYEVCKDFRNEGIDRDHNPEFTMIEYYWAYADYRDMMTFHAELVRAAAKAATEDGAEGAPVFRDGDRTIDLAQPFAEKPLLEAIADETGEDFSDPDDVAARQKAERVGVEVASDASYAKVVDDVFSERVQPKLIEPTYITDYPRALSPLAKMHRDKPGLVERFELFACGRELANAFSELNDPDDQRARFEEMTQAAKRGDEEAHQMDEDFLRAVAHGMPPTAGCGFGLDRLVMTILGIRSIREVIIFPTLRPEAQDGET